MFKKKRGLTLLECVVYLGVLSILSCILVKIIISSDYLYMKTIKIYGENDDINNLFLNIERFINEEDVRNIEVNDQRIVIYKGSIEKNFQKEEIFKEKDKILVKYFDIRNFENYNTRNTMAIDIEYFKVKVKGKLIYLVVKKGGKEYIKCL